jgi:hypothetical protein
MLQFDPIDIFPEARKPIKKTALWGQCYNHCELLLLYPEQSFVLRIWL